jgi:hypothetical protein
MHGTVTNAIVKARNTPKVVVAYYSDDHQCTVGTRSLLLVRIINTKVCSPSSLLQSVKAIRSTVHLAAMEMKDPNAEFRCKVAEAFEASYSSLPERCIRTLLKTLSSPGRQVTYDVPVSPEARLVVEQELHGLRRKAK